MNQHHATTEERMQTGLTDRIGSLGYSILEKENDLRGEKQIDLRGEKEKVLRVRAEYSYDSNPDILECTQTA